jgi:dTDP-4-dehydrorhamnose reductase
MMFGQALGQMNSGKILVLGASGLLGSHVFDTFAKRAETIGTYVNSTEHSKENMYYLNASNYDDLDSFILDLSPTLVINCLGLTDVEVCELRPEASWQLNAAVPSRVSRLSKRKNFKFIHISTDHFQSELRIPRTENDHMRPINQYGYSKFHAESSILAINSNSLVLRTNFFGHSSSGKRSILDFALAAFAKDQVINGFDDVIFSPVGIHEISRFLISENAERATGVLNFASEKPLSKYDFLLEVAKAKGYSDSLVLRSEIVSSSLKVRRPSYLALDPGRLIHEFNHYMPTIGVMLKEELSAIP